MLAIASGKGGSGKTTTTLGVAAAMQGPAVAVDADTDMPNLHALAGVPRDDEGDPPTERPHPTFDGVRVVPAPPGQPRRDDRPPASERLERIGRRTDATVLVDCPAGAGPDVAGPLAAASEALLVTTPCAPALRDTAKTAAMARALGTPVVGVVLVRARVEVPGVAELLDCPLLGRIPPADPPVLADERVRDAYHDVANGLNGRITNVGECRTC
jgi:septum site-determining protein MinD